VLFTDIVCIQEHKLRKPEQDLAIAEGWWVFSPLVCPALHAYLLTEHVLPNCSTNRESFFACTRGSQGYSGIASNSAHASVQHHVSSLCWKLHASAHFHHCAWTHWCTLTCSHTHTHTHARTHARTHKYMCIRTHLHTCAHMLAHHYQAWQPSARQTRQCLLLQRKACVAFFPFSQVETSRDNQQSKTRGAYQSRWDSLFPPCFHSMLFTLNNSTRCSKTHLVLMNGK